MKMINTSECEDCVHCTLDEQNKARIKVVCNLKGKTFYYGQTIPCEDKEIKIVNVKIKKLTKSAVVPTQGNKHSLEVII